MLSFSGPLTFKNAHALHEVAARTPANRILIETDCPYLAPIRIAADATSQPMYAWLQNNWPACVAYRSKWRQQLFGKMQQCLGSC